MLEGIRQNTGDDSLARVIKKWIWHSLMATTPKRLLQNDYSKSPTHLNRDSVDEETAQCVAQVEKDRVIEKVWRMRLSVSSVTAYT